MFFEHLYELSVGNWTCYTVLRNLVQPIYCERTSDFDKISAVVNQKFKVTKIQKQQNDIRNNNKSCKSGSIQVNWYFCTWIV
jgi:hypothetical protein